MLKIRKQTIDIPQKTEATLSDSVLTVRGPLGEISRTFLPEINISIADSVVTCKPIKDDPALKALWGTYVSHISNMVSGVNKPFQKVLIIEGIGFKSEVAGDNLVMALGFSHPVKVAIPNGLKVTAEKNVLTISGIDKEEVGRFTAYIRSLKKPEPYKGKGIRYSTETIRRKEGKKTA